MKDPVSHARTGSSRSLIPFLCGSMSLVWQVLFLVVPLGTLIALSFSGDRVFEGFLPFLNYGFVHILMRSLGMALSTALLTLVIGYPFAYFLVFHGGKFRTFLLFLMMLPFWTNFLLHVCAWLIVLDRSGPLSMFLQACGLIHGPLTILNSQWATAIMMVYFYLPFMVLPLYAVFERFDKRLLEASLDLGANWTQTVARVLLPLTMSGVRIGILLVFIPAFGEFAIPEFMGGNRTMFVGSAIYHFVVTAESTVMGAACTLLASCVLAGVAWLLYRAIGRFVPTIEEEV